MPEAPYPELDEIVIAVVRKIMPYGAFCFIPEYNREAFLHVSHVSSGWVKNIHEYISEGQQLVVKIQNVDKEKNQIDLSLKRVTEDERLKKLESIKREKKGDKLLEYTIKNSKLKITVAELKEKIEAVYDDVLSCFEEASEKGLDAIDEIDVPKKIKEEIVAFSKDRIKKKKAIIENELLITCPTADGINSVKKILDINKENLIIHYIGAPRYKLTFSADDYKKGDKELSKILSNMSDKARSLGCTFEFKENKE